MPVPCGRDSIGGSRSPGVAADLAAAFLSNMTSLKGPEASSTNAFLWGSRDELMISSAYKG
ncbi:hypothetical protein ZHAS_00006479 [Anopheles sinensis]|uniref:Uncharacterized protein n=1 Tax=Anopheles sinensis TaxID=74873 RepID=A0A084VMF3_ANOSI|nr:hypothetical protein ZHAS_00006479 [Anopheles sinensis]